MTERTGTTGAAPAREELRRKCPEPHRDFRRLPTCGAWYTHPPQPGGPSSSRAAFWTWPDERTGDPHGLIHPVVCCESCARPFAWNPELDDAHALREAVNARINKGEDVWS